MEAQLRQSLQRLASLAIDIRSGSQGDTRTAFGRSQCSQILSRHHPPLRQRIVDESQLYYNGMLIGVYELLFVKQNQINAGREYIEALRDYWITRSDLERAVGGRLIVTEETTEPMEQPTTQPSELQNIFIIKEINHDYPA